MKNLLVCPPLYSYSCMLSSEMPIALMKLSTYLKSRGEDVEMFDFLPYKSFYPAQNEVLYGPEMFSMSVEYNDGVVNEDLKCYKSQEYGFHKNSFARMTGEYVSRFGFNRNKYYCGVDKNVFISYLKKNRPDKIWISSGVTFHYKGTVEAINWCKEVYPDVPIELGGIYPTLCYEHAVKNTKADIVHKGISPEWCNSEMDFDVLPYHPQYIIRQLSKGCPNRCKFCSVSYIDGTAVSFVDIDKDIEEIDKISKKYNLTRIKMWGSNTLLPGKGKFFSEWADKLIALDRKFEIVCPEGFAPERLTVDICRKIKDSGFKYIEIPLEDASNETLTVGMKKKYDVSSWNKAVDNALEAGFEKRDIHSAIILGTPGQKESSLEEAVRIMHERGVRPVGRPYTPVPKSEWYEKDDFFPKMDLELLHGYLFPAVRDIDMYRIISKFVGLLADDNHGDYREIIRNYVEDKNRTKQKKKEREMTNELLNKMAQLLIDVAEQQKEIIELLKEKKDEKKA